MRCIWLSAGRPTSSPWTTRVSCSLARSSPRSGRSMRSSTPRTSRTRTSIAGPSSSASRAGAWVTPSCATTLVRRFSQGSFRTIRKTSNGTVSDSWIAGVDTSEEDGMRVAFSAFYCDSTGYGEAARRYLEAFRAVDDTIDLSHGVVLSDGGWVIQPDPWLNAFLKSDPSGPADLHLLQCAAADFDKVRPEFMEAPRVGMTCWETDRLHASSLEGCRSVDHVIVPSTHNAEVLMAAGIQATVVPFPVSIPPSYSDELPCPDLEDLDRDTFLF